MIVGLSSVTQKQLTSICHQHQLSVHGIITWMPTAFELDDLRANFSNLALVLVSSLMAERNRLEQSSNSNLAVTTPL